MKNNRPTLIIPIEIKSREFLARLHVAARAIERGYPVLLGQSKYFHRNLSAFPRGLILENDLTPQGRPFIEHATEMGFGVVAWDEESIVTLTDDFFAELRIDECNLRRARRLFSRGTGDRDAVRRRFPELASKVVATGNPRLEILKPEYYRHQFIAAPPERPVILVNSRFSNVNPFRISPERARANIMRKFKVYPDQPIAKHVNAWFDHAAEALRLFRAMVERLPQAFPDCDIVIRPHPSENAGVWREIADRHKNCIFASDGAAIDWILKSDVLVHNSCTTAVEAALLGVPALAYSPNHHDLYDFFLPNFLSDKFQDEESLFAAIAKTRTRTEAEISQRAIEARKTLADYVAGLGERGSSDIILDEIETDGWRPERPSVGTLVAGLKDRRRRLINRGAALSKQLSAEGRAWQKARAGYLDQKFPHTQTDEIEAVLRRFGLANPQVRAIAPLWWHISQ